MRPDAGAGAGIEGRVGPPDETASQPLDISPITPNPNKRGLYRKTERACVSCGVIFSGTSRKTCSYTCWVRATGYRVNEKYVGVPRVEKNCVVCGSGFSVTVGIPRTTCSKACREFAHRKPLPSQDCVYCKSSFGPSRRGVRYCSERCCRLANHANAAPAVSERTCVSCGANFTSVRRLSCSDGCARKRQNSQRKEYREMRRRASRVSKTIAKSARPPCEACGYSLHTDRCHLIPASAGGMATPDNIINLCKNHHWEFDNGKLSLESMDAIGWGFMYA